MTYGAEELLQEKQNEIDRLTEYEDRAEKAEEALRKILNYLELGNEKTYNKANEILEDVGCFPFHGWRVRK